MENPKIFIFATNIVYNSLPVERAYFQTINGKMDEDDYEHLHDVFDNLPTENLQFDLSWLSSTWKEPKNLSKDKTLKWLIKDEIFQKTGCKPVSFDINYVEWGGKQIALENEISHYENKYSREIQERTSKEYDELDEDSDEEYSEEINSLDDLLS